MLTKNEIKDIQSLYQKKERDEQKLFIAEGPKLAAEILSGKIEVIHVYGTANWIKNNKHDNVRISEITEIELKKISNLQTPNEVVIVARQIETSDEITLKDQLTLVLDGIQDPGNMGTILRIADWFGLSQVIYSNDSVDVYNPKVVQSSMGSLFRLNCWYKDFQDWQPVGVPVYGAVFNGENVYSLNSVSEGVLIIGNESKGIREPLLSLINNPVTIPKIGEAESLNAAVAAGIIVSWFTKK